MTNKPTVAVIGATGYTGRFTVMELIRRGLTPIAIARDAEALSAADFTSLGAVSRHATVDDAESLDRSIHGAQVVINCAGPFAATAHAVVAAAIRAKAHYIDVCAEQAVVEEILDLFDEPARQANVAVVPAMAFYGGFAHLLTVAALGDWSTADSVDIMVGLDSWHPTPGSRNAINKTGNLVVTGGKLVPETKPAQRKWRFEEPLGEQAMVGVQFSEIILISRHIKAAEIHNYISQAALDDILNEATPAPEAVDEMGRSAQRFIMDAVVTRDGKQRMASARGQDSYAASASLSCEAAERLLQGRYTSVGAHTPGEMFDAPDFLTALDLDYSVSA
ncbi:saccharopine dehydrogenase NADP-binding domain-containing protein [Streptosporangium subroseum]|uniref:saccharopine dehydrogenase NADP-binding domain-containing protein n=1 Tax=Streptosporangium subroseum TaxID=106412 RepID=UPI00308EE412|nr:saccharopine dehydrogenase NADP-binding domain-containing protein [Streptosporangium subroseum]